MSKYTTTFHRIAEVIKGDFVTYNEGVTLALQRIFEEPIPFYNNVTEDINEFKQLFISQYFDEELGLETVDLFIGRLYNKLNMIMPKYKLIYESMSIKFQDIFENINESTTDNRINYGTTHDDSTLTHGLKTKTEGDETGYNNRSDDFINNRTDNLQNKVVNDLTSKLVVNDDEQSLQSDEPNTTITNNAYASMLNKTERDNTHTTTDTGSTTSNNTGTQNNTNKGTSNTDFSNTINNTVTNSGNDSTENNGEFQNVGEYKTIHSGFNGNKNQLIAEYRNNILNINEQIIKECSSLFMTIF